MGLKRGNFQGVTNIIMFNWHFYVIAFIVSIFLYYGYQNATTSLQNFLLAFLLLILSATTIPLLVSFYIYDCSNLYDLPWLPDTTDKTVLNINAGFDEISELIMEKSPNTHLTICDFYDPEKHTESSIMRARKAYPPLSGTIQVSTSDLNFPNHRFDHIIVFLSAHEIRDMDERIRFFKELGRITEITGQIYVTEHLRDLYNFVAFSIGFLHFHSNDTWLKTFNAANLSVAKTQYHTPFIKTYTLVNHGDSL